MRSIGIATVLLLVFDGTSRAARCTTVIGPGILHEYEVYVAQAERLMPSRFDLGELSWVGGAQRKEAIARLTAGRPVRSSIKDASWNQRIADRNGTIIHWIGGIRISGVVLDEVDSVLGDYASYPQIYRPMVSFCRAGRDALGAKELTLGLQSTFRFASLIPQHYAFQAEARIDRSDARSRGDRVVRAHLQTSEIRESDSGVPGRNDLLEPYHDHGIMWALNGYWRARQTHSDVYLEFETITLARSAQSFVCRISLIPIPRSVVSSAMDSIPSESVTTVLEGTKSECERKARLRTRNTPAPQVSGN